MDSVLPGFSQLIQWRDWILPSLFSSLALYVAARIINFFRKYNEMRSITDKLPGPKPSYFWGNMLTIMSAIKPRANLPSGAFIIEYLGGLAHIYRKETLVSFWYPFSHSVVLINFKSVEPLLTSTTEVDKSLDYRFFDTWLGQGLITSTGFKWKKRRKMLTPAFHFRILESFQPIISEHSQILVQVLSKLPNLYCPSVLEVMSLATLDVICETALGLSVGAQLENQNSAYAKAVKEMTSHLCYRAVRPWLWNNFIYSFTESGKEWKRCLTIVKDFTKNVIKDRKESYQEDNSFKRRLAFLDILLEEQRKDQLFTDEDIQDEVDTFAVAGHDTTANGTTWCLYMIGLYPEIQRRVQSELTDIFGEDRDGMITIEHCKAMKYLDCVLKETHRVYPAVPVIGRTLKENIVMDNHLIPASTTCYVNMYLLHRDPVVFPNPEVFDPDRFLPENCATRHPFAYVPFSAGPRNCIGQRFAASEEKTMIANILRNFNVKSLDQRDKIAVLIDVVSRPAPDIRMQFERR